MRDHPLAEHFFACAAAGVLLAACSGSDSSGAVTTSGTASGSVQGTSGTMDVASSNSTGSSGANTSGPSTTGSGTTAATTGGADAANAGSPGPDSDASVAAGDAIVPSDARSSAATPSDARADSSGPASSDGGSGTAAGNFTRRFAAPYVPTWNDTNLVTLSSATGNQFWTLAFVISKGGCTPSWNGDTDLGANNFGKYIDGLRAAGGDVLVSFGGASGIELGQACTSVASLQTAYQKVVDQFHLTWLDLDIESGAESDTPSVERRNQALHNLQAAQPGLRVSYTLAVDRTGLPSADLNVIKSAKANGVTVNIVNVMAMDFGPCYTDMGQAAIDSANATRGQLAAIGMTAQVGVTPMIGTNDVACEHFTTMDAQQLVTYALSNAYIGLLAYWSQDADTSHSYINIFKTFH